MMHIPWPWRAAKALAHPPPRPPALPRPRVIASPAERFLQTHWPMETTLTGHVNLEHAMRALADQAQDGRKALIASLENEPLDFAGQKMWLESIQSHVHSINVLRLSIVPPQDEAAPPRQLPPARSLAGVLHAAGPPLDQADPADQAHAAVARELQNVVDGGGD